MKAIQNLTKLSRRGATTSTQVQFTSEHYPYLKRGRYAHLTDKTAQFFESLLGPHRVLTNPDEVLGYNVDWLKMVRGASTLVLRPENTEQVSAIMKKCFEENLAVCPQGGNTGLVGGSVPVFDEIVISTSLMNKIHHIDPVSGVLSCQSGCVLEQLDQKLEEVSLMMPLDLAAKGSCQIGGNLSTSAGGIRLIRYGTLHANTLGIQAVLADGSVIDCMNTHRKDNTGYHLKNMFIGSEGTLGIITGAVIQCPVRPSAITLSFVGLESYSNVVKTLHLAKESLNEILSSCEVMDSISMETVNSKLGLKSPLQMPYNYYMLIETHGSSLKHDEEKVDNFLEKAMAKEFVKDGVTTQQPSTINKLWQLRERIVEALTKDDHMYTYDVSLPLENYYQIVDVVREELKDFKNVTVSCMGHIGDGNAHLNITIPQPDNSLEAKVESFVFKWVRSCGGSISAEHGIGFKKAGVLRATKDPVALKTMATIKKQLDPKGILNPYKVLVPEVN